MPQQLDRSNLDHAARATIADALAGARAASAAFQVLVKVGKRDLCVRAVEVPAGASASTYLDAAARRAATGGRRLLPVVDVGEHSEWAWIAYDVGSTTPLAEYRKRLLLPTATSLRVLGDVARALDEAAEDGVFAYEVGPESVFVSRRGARLGDLGTAREAFGGDGAGSDPAFVPPEVLHGEPAVARSGVYVFGALLYHLLAGASPRRDARSNGDGAAMASLAGWRPDLPPAMDAVVAAATADEPTRRLRAAGEVYDLARRAIRGELPSGWTATAAPAAAVRPPDAKRDPARPIPEPPVPGPKFNWSDIAPPLPGPDPAERRGLRDPIPPRGSRPAPMPEPPTVRKPAPEPKTPSVRKPAPEPKAPSLRKPAPEPKAPTLRKPAPEPKAPTFRKPTPEPDAPTIRKPVAPKSAAPSAPKAEPAAPPVPKQAVPAPPSPPKPKPTTTPPPPAAPKQAAPAPPSPPQPKPTTTPPPPAAPKQATPAPPNPPQPKPTTTPPPPAAPKQAAPAPPSPPKPKPTTTPPPPAAPKQATPAPPSPPKPKPTTTPPPPAAPKQAAPAPPSPAKPPAADKPTPPAPKPAATAPPSPPAKPAAADKPTAPAPRPPAAGKLTAPAPKSAAGAPPPKPAAAEKPTAPPPKPAHPAPPSPTKLRPVAAKPTAPAPKPAPVEQAKPATPKQGVPIQATPSARKPAAPDKSAPPVSQPPATDKQRPLPAKPPQAARPTAPSSKPAAPWKPVPPPPKPKAADKPAARDPEPPATGKSPDAKPTADDRKLAAAEFLSSQRTRERKAKPEPAPPAKEPTPKPQAEPDKSSEVKTPSRAQEPDTPKPERARFRDRLRSREPHEKKPADRPAAARRPRQAEPQPAASPPRVRSKSSGTRRRRIVAIGGAVLLGSVAGVLLGGSPEPEPARAKVVSAAGMRVTLPPDWEVARGVGALAVRLEGDPGSRLEARLVDEPLKRDEGAEPVQLGALQAWRSTTPDSLRYAAPTTAGTLLITCQAPPAGPRLLGLCERTASTLDLRTASPLPLAGVIEEEGRLRAAIESLRADRATGRRRLARAERPSGQREVARALARSHERAAGQLAQISGAEPVEAAVRETAAAYSALAKAAPTGKSTRWNRARDRVRRHDAMLAEVLDAAEG